MAPQRPHFERFGIGEPMGAGGEGKGHRDEYLPDWGACRQVSVLGAPPIFLTDHCSAFEGFDEAPQTIVGQHPERETVGPYFAALPRPLFDYGYVWDFQVRLKVARSLVHSSLSPRPISQPIFKAILQRRTCFLSTPHSSAKSAS